MLKLSLKKQSEGVGMGFNWLRIQFIFGCFENGNKLSCFTKGRNFFTQRTILTSPGSTLLHAITFICTFT